MEKEKQIENLIDCYNIYIKISNIIKKENQKETNISKKETSNIIIKLYFKEKFYERIYQKYDSIIKKFIIREKWELKKQNIQLQFLMNFLTY